LRRELGVFGATFLGLGSILGTGVFVSLGLVAGIAYGWTPWVVLAAAGVATCNALSSAQLAAAHPQSGGTYEYGYRLIHPLAGFTAGWMFLCAKSASAATAALGVSAYLLHGLGLSTGDARILLASGVVVLLTALVASGLRRSSDANVVVVTITLLALLAFVAFGSVALFGREPSLASVLRQTPQDLAWSQLLQATALMFVAYTGYGRVATLGEEVREPRKNIPRAIILTLVVSSLVYLLVSVVALWAFGGSRNLASTAESGALLAEVSRSFGYSFLPALLSVGAITAMIGVLLNLLLGLSRVLLAMGRRSDMPGFVAQIHEGNSSPVAAVVVVGVIVLGLTLMGSIKTAWSFSAFTVLVYYAITNLAALRLPKEDRLYPRLWSICGLVSCLLLAFWVDRTVWLAGLGVLSVGWIWFAVRRSRL
ncbi:MAG: amino acid permease, partial [Candidatus Eisenbacteria bacterium]|nr:amino acid permease [Candidatus Eisenbacteria bacterium]